MEDNVTGGAPGDRTIVLQHLLRSRISNAVVAGIRSPTIVKECLKAGIGRKIALMLGCDHTMFKNETMDVVAEIVGHGDSIVDVRSNYGSNGPWVKVKIGGVLATFHQRRVGILTQDDFVALGIDPRARSIYVVKQGYLFAELQEVAKRHLLLLSPGATQFDLTKRMSTETCRAQSGRLIPTCRGSQEERP